MTFSVVEEGQCAGDLLQQAASWLVQGGGLAAARVCYWQTAHSTLVAYAGRSASTDDPTTVRFGAGDEAREVVIEIAPTRALTAEGRRSLDDLGRVLVGALRRVDRAACESLSAMDLVPLAIMRIDLESGRLVRYNRRLCDLLGYGREQLLGLRIADLISADARHGGPELVQLLREGAVREHEGDVGLVRKDRSVVWCSVSASIASEPRGSRQALFFITVRTPDAGADVTEAHAEAAGKCELLKRVADHVPGMLSYWDATLTCRFANRAYEAWLGDRGRSPLGRPKHEVLGPLYALDLPHIEGALCGVPQRFERAFPDPETGTHRRAIAEYVPDVVDGTVRGFFVQVSDASLLKDAEERFRSVVEASPIPYALNDERANITYLNPAFVRLFGYTLEDIRTLEDWWPAAYPDATYREWVSEEWSTRTSRAQAEGRSFEPLELRIRAKDGTTKIVMAFAASLAAEWAGPHLVVLFDLSEVRRLESERHELASLLSHSQRLESIGRLAAGIAHDFNNLLTVIVASAELVEDELGEQHHVTESLRDILEAARRAEALTHELLAFSRREPRTVEPLDLSELLAGLDRMLRRVLGKDVSLSFTGGERPHMTMADRGELGQVLLNLAVNARDAMPSGGELSLSLADVDLDDAAAARHGLAGGRYVELHVTDTGTGMDAATQSRIFEPFFTTKEVGRGTGLGLAAVFGVVKELGGAIAVSSQPDEGTTFCIRLPRLEDAKPSVRPRMRSTVGGPAVLAGASVLVVDDDTSVLT